MLRLVALVLAAVVACSHEAVPRGPAEPDTPPVVEPLAPPITLTIANPATAYDEDLPSSNAATGPTPQHDPRLDAAAAELLAVVQQGAALSPQLVQFATHAHGVVEPPAFYLTQPPRDVLERWNTRVGTAGQLTVVIHVGSVRFTALPRGFTGSYELHATLGPPYEDPRVTVTGSDGSVAHPSVTVDGNAFRASIICSGTTSLITVEADVGGPLAVVPVTCGTPANTMRVEPEHNLKTTDVERRLIALINRERIAAGLAPLRPDRRTARAAAGSARAMTDAEVTARDGEDTSARRVAEAGGRPRHMVEMTFRAADLAQASMRLLNDPIARAQILAKDVTHIGVAVATSTNGELAVAIDYIQVVPALDAAALEARVVRQIIDRHNTVRLKPLFAIRTRIIRIQRRFSKDYMSAPPFVDEVLQERARTYATMLAAGWRAASIDQRLSGTMPTQTAINQIDPHRRYRRVEKKIVEVTDPAHVDESNLFADGDIVEAIGVGVAQSPPDSALAGRIFMVILFAPY